MKLLFCVLLLILALSLESFTVHTRFGRRTLSFPSVIAKRNGVSNRRIALDSQILKSTKSTVEMPRWTSLSLRWATGLSLAAMGSVWIASNKHIFLLGFLAIFAVAQRELSAMIGLNDQQQPLLSKIVPILSLIIYLTAAYSPSLHNIVYPISVAILISWLFICKNEQITLKDVALNSFSILYLAQMPSYWIRLHGIAKIQSSFSLNPYLWSIGQKLTWLTVATIGFSGISLHSISLLFRYFL